MCEIIEELGKLTKILPATPTLSDLVGYTDNDGINYRVKNGEARANCLISSESICVQKLFLKKGTVFTFHTHEHSTEYVILYKGKIKLTRKDGFDLLINSGFAIIEMGVIHGGEAIEDSLLITTTVPGDIEGYAK